MNKDSLRLLIRVFTQCRLVLNQIFKIDTIFNIYVQVSIEWAKFRFEDFKITIILS